MDRYLIFLDIDGTIFDGQKVSDRVKNTIGDARKEGHKVFINTGRSFGNITEDIKSLGVDGFVTGLGTAVRVDGKVIRSCTMKKEKAKELASYLLERKLRSCFECEDRSVFMNTDLERNLSSPDELDGRFADIIISKFTVFDKMNEEDVSFLEKDFTVFQYENYSEGVKKGYSKAKGMEIAGNFLGVGRDNMMAIGDSMNDFDMIAYAGIGVAMGNADIKIKKKAKYITEHIKDDGAAVAIEKYILGR